MKVAALPPSEHERLAALRRAALLDTPPEEAFDDAARLASRLCGTPIALVSLVDARRQWFKARVGLEATETSREVAFCAHAILERGAFVVGDAAADERFRDNPLVTGEPRIRFYAGVPLIAEADHALGTLCVIDRAPRTLTEEQLDSLAALARQVASLVRLRLLAAELEKRGEAGWDFLDSVSDLVQSVGPDGRFRYTNRVWHEVLGYSREDASRLSVFDIIAPEHREECGGIFARLMRGEPVGQILTTFVAKDGRRIRVEGSANVQRRGAEAIATRAVFRDVTARLDAEAEASRTRTQLEAQAALLDLADDAIVVRDMHDRITFWNRGAERLYGWSREAALGRVKYDLLAAEFAQPLSEILARVTATGAWEGEVSHRAADGRRVIVESRWALRRDASGTPECILEVIRDVSERRRIERELESVSALHRAILDAAPYSIISTDREGTIRTFSRGAERMLGYRADELVGRATPRPLHDEAEIAARAETLARELGAPVSPGFDVFVAKAARGDATDANEWTYVRKDGTRLPVLLSVVALRDGAGSVTGYVGIGRDLTVEKAIESALRESEERLRRFLDTSPALVFVKDADLRFAYVNRRLAAAVGCSPADLLGRRNREAFPPELATALDRWDRAAVASESGVELEETIRLAAGPGTFLVSLVPVRDHSGALRSVHGLATDITERRRTEDAFRESLARHRAVLDTAVNAIFTIDERGLLDSFNAAAERIFGYEAREVVGQGLARLVGEPGRPGFGEALAGLDPGSIGKTREVVGRRRDGSVFPAELAVSETRFGERRIFTGILRDITERKALDRVKNEFVSTVSHELRTPLTSIRGALGLLEEGVVGELPAEAIEVIGIARSNADRLIRLVNAILDLEKMQAGKLELKLVELSPEELVRAALDGIRGMAAETSVAASAAVATRAKVRADGDRIVQVLTNLLSNAVKFSPAGAPVAVRVHEPEPGRVRFAVVDRGPGIPLEQQAKLFEKFQQLDASDSRRQGGTGLGLAISRSIVEQHGGAIGVESRPGEGSTFWFDLPASGATLD